MTPIDRSPSALSTREQLTLCTRLIVRRSAMVGALFVGLIIVALCSLGLSVSTFKHNASITTIVMQQQSLFFQLMDQSHTLVEMVRQDATVPALIPQEQKSLKLTFDRLQENKRSMFAQNKAFVQPWFESIDVDRFYSRPPYMLSQELNRFEVWFMHLVEASPEFLAKKYDHYFPLEALIGDVDGVTRTYERLNSHLDTIRSANYKTHQLIVFFLLPCILLCVILFAFLWLRPALQEQRLYHDKLSNTHNDLGWQVEHDPVTELANAARAEIELKNLVSEVNSNGQRYAAYLTRVHNLNALYEELGSQRLALLLQTVADRLRILFSDAVCLARVSERDFLVVPDERASSETVEQTAQKIIHAIEKTITLDYRAINPVVNIGMTLLPENGNSVDDIRSNCEIALGESIQSGRSVARAYQDSMRKPLDQANVLAEEIRFGLDRGEFSAFFQPKFNLIDGTYCGCEALIRWNHPTEGLLLPAEFLSAANDAGLMNQVTQIMIKNVERHCRAWSDNGLDAKSVALNIPERTLFTDSVVEKIESLATVFSRLGLRLELEIAEDVAVMQERANLDGIAERLYELDVTYILDDFGAGIASLTHLHSLPFEVVQLERKLVSDIDHGETPNNQLETLLNLIHALGKNSAAKGIETERHYQYLKELGCHIGQGLLFSQVLAPEAMGQFIAGESHSQLPVLARQSG